MATNELDQAQTQEKYPAECKAAVEKLSKEASNDAFLQDVLKACPRGDVPGVFPASKDLVAPTVDKAHEQNDLRQLEKAVKGGFWGPDKDTVEKTLTSANSAERAMLQQDFANDQHKPLLQAFAEQFSGTGSEDYHRLKGLLLRDDSPESMAAVNLHMQLMQIDDQSKQIALHNKGTNTGFDNNLIDNNSFDAGTAGGLDALGSLAGSFSRGQSNNELASAVAKIKPDQMTKIEAEHERIYRRDLGDLVENAQGLSDQALKAFKKFGVE